MQWHSVRDAGEELGRAGARLASARLHDIANADLAKICRVLDLTLLEYVLKDGLQHHLGRCVLLRSLVRPGAGSACERNDHYVI